MSTTSEQKRKRLTIGLGVASAIAFGGMYAVIARGTGGTGATTQAEAVTLDPTTYSELTSSQNTITSSSSDDDENEHEGDDDEGDDESYYENDDDDNEGTSSQNITITTPAPKTTHAPVVTPQPQTKTRGS